MSDTTQVFKAEIDDGLAETIRASNSVAYASAVQFVEKFDLTDSTTASLLKAAGQEHIVASEGGHLNLYYLKSILASTVWNLNDDVFTAENTWVARHTPVDQPFNYNHDSADIIGHITGSYVVGDDMKVVPDDTKEIPSKFHIVAGAVLYKYWPKSQAKQERMDKIIAEIPDGKWFVSMEALFRGFDYAMETDDGIKVVARNDETAFLTKHLRAYGGKGVYNGQKIGRLMHNIVFSGKGLVENPANPESIIFAGLKKSGYSSGSDNSHQTEERNQMSDELKAVQAKLETVIAENKELQKALKENDVKQLQSKLEAAEAALKMKADELANMLKLSDEQKTADKAALEMMAATKTKLTETEAKLEEATKSLQQIEAQKLFDGRVALVVEKLKLPKEKAEAMVKDTLPLSAEAFENTVKTMEPMAASQAKATAGVETKEAKTPTPAAATAALETAKADDEPALAVVPVSKDAADFQKAVASYFGYGE